MQEVSVLNEVAESQSMAVPKVRHVYSDSPFAFHSWHWIWQNLVDARDGTTFRRERDEVGKVHVDS